MTTCKSGRVIKKEKQGREFYFLRLNLVEIGPDGSKKYTSKDIPANLEATKRNYSKANAMLDEAITEYSHEAERMFFHKYLQGWLESKRPALETITYEGYQYRLGHVADYFEQHKVLLTELKPEHVRDFYNHLLTVEHGTGKRRQTGYSNRSIKDIAVLLKSALEDAVMLGYISENPAGRIKVPKRNCEHKDKAYIGADEVDIFFDAIKGHCLEIPFKLILFFGLRREEACGLRWSAVRNGRIYIEHTVSHMKSTVAKDRTKTDASYRSYPIPSEIQESLDILKQKQEEYRILFGNSYVDTDYCFTWPDGRPYSPDYLTKSFKKLVRSDGRLDDTLTLHSLRASCVSILVHNGVDIKDIQTWVGHSDISTTMNIYARTNEKQKTNTANSMAELLFGGKAKNS